MKYFHVKCELVKGKVLFKSAKVVILENLRKCRTNWAIETMAQLKSDVEEIVLGEYQPKRSEFAIGFVKETPLWFVIRSLGNRQT